MYQAELETCFLKDFLGNKWEGVWGCLFGVLLVLILENVTFIAKLYQNYYSHF